MGGLSVLQSVFINLAADGPGNTAYDRDCSEAHSPSGRSSRHKDLHNGEAQVQESRW